MERRNCSTGMPFGNSANVTDKMSLSVHILTTLRELLKGLHHEDVAFVCATNV